MKMTKQLYMMGIMAWFMGSLYYLYQYILRVSPMVMVDDIRADFLLDASTFGSLMAIGTYCYSAMQIPVGILSDLFGARRMIVLSLVSCIIGIGLFSYTEYMLFAYFGRILIGLGSAAGFVCASKISSEWFPAHQKPLWFAGVVVMGTFGAYLGGNPLAQLVAERGWRESLQVLTIVGVGVLVLNLLFLRNRTSSQLGSLPILSRHETWEQIKTVFLSRYCWMYAIVALGMYLSISVFADLWGVPFLQNKFGVDREVAATTISMAYFGVCAGVVVTSLLSQFIKDSRPIIGISALLVAVLMAVVTFYEGLSFPMVTVLMFMIGVFAGGEVLCFAQACEHMPVSVAATVTGFLNFIITLGAATIQQGFGYALDWFWSGQLDAESGRIYALSDYQNALFIVILIASSSVFLSFFLPKDIVEEEGA